MDTQNHTQVKLTTADLFVGLAIVTFVVAAEIRHNGGIFINHTVGVPFRWNSTVICFGF